MGTGGEGIVVCFGIAFLVPEPFLEMGCGFLLAMGIIAATPAVGKVVQEGITTEDTFNPFPIGPQLDPLPPFELGPLPDPLNYNPGPTLDAGLEQTLTLPGFPTDQAEPTARIYDFPLVQQPCEDSIIFSGGRVPLAGGATDLPTSLPNYNRGSVEWVNINDLEVFHGPEGRGGAGYDVPTLMQEISTEGYDPYEAIPVAITLHGRKIIGGGHHRLEAVKRLGYTYIPANVFREMYNDPAAWYFRDLETRADSYKASQEQ